MFISPVRLPGGKLFKLTVCIFLILMTAPAAVISRAEETSVRVSDLIEPQLKSSEIRNLQKKLEESITDDARNILTYFSAGQLMEELVRGNVKSGMGASAKIIDLITKEIKQISHCW